MRPPRERIVAGPVPDGVIISVCMHGVVAGSGIAPIVALNDGNPAVTGCVPTSSARCEFTGHGSISTWIRRLWAIGHDEGGRIEIGECNLLEEIAKLRTERQDGSNTENGIRASGHATTIF